MKYILLLGLFLFSGCEYEVTPTLNERDTIKEFCYKGTTYLKINSRQSAWGMVKMPLEKCNSFKK